MEKIVVCLKLILPHSSISTIFTFIDKNFVMKQKQPPSVVKITLVKNVIRISSTKTQRGTNPDQAVKTIIPDVVQSKDCLV